MLRMIPQLLLWLLLSNCTLAQTDCDWVRMIYYNMGGDVQKIPQNCCEMQQIVCVKEDVTSIFWTGHGLARSIPPEIGMLLKLKSL
jgi:hypothetical protein